MPRQHRQTFHQEEQYGLHVILLYRNTATHSRLCFSISKEQYPGNIGFARSIPFNFHNLHVHEQVHVHVKRTWKCIILLYMYTA